MQGVNFFLVGMPGSGKTTVGKMLAQGMGYRWIDVDQHIEAVRSGRWVAITCSSLLSFSEKLPSCAV
jgi:shikimate kinase